MRLRVIRLLAKEHRLLEAVTSIVSNSRPGILVGPLVGTQEPCGYSHESRAEKVRPVRKVAEDEEPNEDCSGTYQTPNMHHHDEELIVFVGDGQLHLPSHLPDGPGP